MDRKKSKFKDPYAIREAQKYEDPIPSREFILEKLKNRDKAFNYDKLAKELNIKKNSQHEALKKRLRAMVRDKQLEQVKGGYKALKTLDLNNVDTELQEVAASYALPYEWSEEVMAEIAKIKPTLSAADLKNRIDLRTTPLVTIDGNDSKDFDDAVYCEQKLLGGFKLIVAIADVAHYVKLKSALDTAALERGNSVYFPSKVIPMLPEALSNGLCSLNPEVDRLVLCCELSISKSGKVSRSKFYEGVMRSQARLTYNEVYAYLNGEKPEFATSVFAKNLNSLYKLYQVLSKVRHDRGAIEFDTIESKIVFDKELRVIDVKPYERNTAHRIIEECMLLANVAAAKLLLKHKSPALYRNHEGPVKEKLADLRAFLNALGLSLPGKDNPHPKDYAKLLASTLKRSDHHVIQTVLLRSLSQANYAPNNLGHFGLAYECYTHFTSPIRRYPDLVVHRQLKRVIKEDKIKALTEKELEALQKIGEHTSATERRADEATRDITRWLKCQYIKGFIGHEFTGVITGVVKFGLFVEIKNFYIDGLLHIGNLTDDYYIHDAVHHRLIGERTGRVYRLGDSINIKVSKVDIAERKVDFELSRINKKN